MLESRSGYQNSLLGWERERSIRFLGLTGGVCLVTFTMSVLGSQLLQSWSEQRAHLAIEVGAFLLFIFVVGAAVVNAYLYGGLIVSVALPMALVFGFSGFLVAETVMTGTPLPSPSTVRSLGTISLWMGLIGASAHLLGSALRLVVAERIRLG